MYLGFPNNKTAVEILSVFSLYSTNSVLARHTITFKAATDPCSEKVITGLYLEQRTL